MKLLCTLTSGALLFAAIVSAERSDAKELGAGRPRLVAVTGCRAQGESAVEKERWDAKTRTLSGVVTVVANAACELRISVGEGAGVGPVVLAALTGGSGYELVIAPGEGVVARPDDAYSNANTPEQPMTYLHAPETKEGFVRVAFSCGTAGQVTWKVRFAERGDAAQNAP